MADNVSTMDSKQYIVVELGNEQYGIDIQYIDNIVINANKHFSRKHSSHLSNQQL